MKRIVAPLCSLVLLAWPLRAEEVYFDGAITNGELNLLATELFQFGPYGAAGEWGVTNITVGGNQVIKVLDEEVPSGFQTMK